jgi:hypothetical protein
MGASFQPADHSHINHVGRPRNSLDGRASLPKKSVRDVFCQYAETFPARPSQLSRPPSSPIWGERRYVKN